MLNEKLKALYRSRAAAHKEAQDLLTAAHAADRELTSEERAKTSDLIKKVELMTDEIRQVQKLQEQAASLAAVEDRLSEQISEGAAGSGASARVELRKSVARCKREVKLTDNISEDAANQMLARRIEREFGIEARTALQAGNDLTGGIFIAPLVMQAGLLKDLDDALFLRQICTVLPPLTTAESTGIFTRDTAPDDPTDVGELSTGDEDTSIRFGMRELTPHPMARYVKISEKLIRMVPGFEQMVLSELVYRFSHRFEYLLYYGNGTQQPLGLMTASDNGISTSRDSSTYMPASGTEVGIDGLKYAMWKKLKPEYRTKAVWVVPTTLLYQLDTIKDGEGRYIWQPSVVPGVPDRLLGRPYYESAIMDTYTTWTSGNYVGLFGDFSKYSIVDALTMRMQRLVETWATTNQIGWLLRMESDGQPMVQEAFVRLKLA